MLTTPSRAKTEMLAVLREIETNYALAEQIVLAFRASLETGSESPDIGSSLRPVMEKLLALDRRLSTAYGHWKQGAGARDAELHAAVDRARFSLTRLFQLIDGAVTTAQTHLTQLGPNLAAASSHRNMTQAYQRSTSLHTEANR